MHDVLAVLLFLMVAFRLRRYRLRLILLILGKGLRLSSASLPVLSGPFVDT